MAQIDGIKNPHGSIMALFSICASLFNGSDFLNDVIAKSSDGAARDFDHVARFRVMGRIAFVADVSGRAQGPFVW